MNLKDLNLSTPITKNVSVSNRTYIVEEAINTVSDFYASAYN